MLLLVTMKRGESKKEAEADGVVKVDSELLKKIEGLIKKNKFLYSSKKQVVNLAIIEFLNAKELNKNIDNMKKR